MVQTVRITNANVIRRNTLLLIIFYKNNFYIYIYIIFGVINIHL